MDRPLQTQKDWQNGWQVVATEAVRKLKESEEPPPPRHGQSEKELHAHNGAALPEFAKGGQRSTVKTGKV